MTLLSIILETARRIILALISLILFDFSLSLLKFSLFNTVFMNRKSLGISTKSMAITSKSKNVKQKVVSCSTPEYDSPSRDSDSLCDSEATSPVPFLCTQDGADGETDVVWNYYTPKADNSTSRLKNSTPLSRKEKRTRPIITKKDSQPKRRPLRTTQKKTEVFQELIELNQNLHKFIDSKKTTSGPIHNSKSDADEDILNSSLSPKSGLKTNSRCLRKNLLSSKFNKPEPETALESDDSMNECLLKASQIVEEKILKADDIDVDQNRSNHIFHDSVDSLFTNIKLESPVTNNIKKNNSSCLNNDSFDNFVGNLNDSALERLTQLPARNVTPLRKKKADATSDWILQDVKIHGTSPSAKNVFGRHNSMPESPTVDASKPSSSGMIFGRHNSMPYNNNGNTAGSGDSPIRCTPDEIRKKHIQAREKLLAKRLLPFTTTQQSQCEERASAAKKPCFQPRVPSTSLKKPNVNVVSKSDESNIKMLIEKKRQEALMKLRRKQPR